MADITYPILLSGTFRANYKSWLSKLVKRLLDISASAIGILLLSPIFLFLIYRIKRDSPGPAFYRGPRTGKDGRTFGILKFRTMREEAASYAGPKVTAQDDPRVTPLGRWLRDTKLNELPQLWNVLKGEMSLVGPRPEDPEIAAGWDPDARREVLSVRPGITSPASVLFRKEETLLHTGDLMRAYLGEVLPSKLRLDQLYVRRRSFLLDLDTLFWTFLLLLPRLGRFQPPEDLLFWGPIARLVRRYVSWFSIDAITTLLAFVTAGAIYRAFTVINVGWERSLLMAMLFSLLFSSVAALMGVQKVVWSSAPAEDALDLLPPLMIVGGAAVLIESLKLFPHMLPSKLIVLATALSCAGYTATRYRTRLVSGMMSRWVRRRGALAQERVLVVGGGDSGQLVAWMLHNTQAAAGMEVMGFVDDDLYMQGERLYGSPVLGKRMDIPRLVRQYDIGVIVFAIHNIPALERRHILGICAQTKARVVMLPDFVGALQKLSAISSKLSVKNVASLNVGMLESSGVLTCEPSHLETCNVIPEWQKDRLACEYCFARSSPIEVEGLLADLAVLAAEGDVEALRAKLARARESITFNV